MAEQGSGSATASFALLLTGTLVMLMMSGGALAITYNVGDDQGWILPSSTNGLNYTEWAAKHEFVVGDVLHFEYAAGSHNVQPMPDGVSTTSCNLTAAVVDALIGGSNDITLKTPGGKWYVCGVGQHCQAGMKFKINVAAGVSAPPPTAPGPIPSETGSASTLAVSSTVTIVAGAVLLGAATLFV